MATRKKTKEEVFRVRGDELKAKIKDILREGNARRIIIKNKSGKTLIEFPVTVGVVGVVLAPVWIAIGAIAAVVAECSITVEKRS